MARIAGVDLPDNKRMEIALTYIYGVGRNRSLIILKRAGIDSNKRAHELTEEEAGKIRDIIEENYKVEGDLKNEVNNSIRRLIEIKCYRGIRHVKGLPLRGQRTKTNSRTRKGRVKTVANKKIQRK